MIEQGTRQDWMGLLARAPVEAIDRLWTEVSEVPSYRFLRKPEQGLAMVRGRMGGNGDAFNMGEMTITRCSVALDDGTVGHAYVSGRSKQKAERAALLDAMLQREDQAQNLQERIIQPLKRAEEEARRTKAAKSAATKVDFFTMVRGED